MDSGIDSTESSNGSVEEVEGAMEAAPSVDPHSSPNYKNAVVSSSLSPSSSSSQPTASPNTPSSSSTSSTTLAQYSAPSSLRALAASTVNEIQTEVVENVKNQSEPIQGGSQVMKTPPNTPAHNTFKLVSQCVCVCVGIMQCVSLCELVCHGWEINHFALLVTVLG